MRTWKIIIDQRDKHAAFRAYCGTNTADSKCMYIPVSCGCPKQSQ